MTHFYDALKASYQPGEEKVSIVTLFDEALVKFITEQCHNNIVYVWFVGRKVIVAPSFKGHKKNLLKKLSSADVDTLKQRLIDDKVWQRCRGQLFFGKGFSFYTTVYENMMSR